MAESSHGTDGKGEVNAKRDPITVTGIIPVHSDDELARLADTELVACLCRDEDRVPRNLIDACAARGNALVQVLRERLGVSELSEEGDDGQWWLTHHAAMIAGLIPTEGAGRLLVHLMRRMEETGDLNMQEWLSGTWPALFANKPITLVEPLRAVAEKQDDDFLTRVNAAEAAIRLALQEGEAPLESALDWLAGIASDEGQDWQTRLGLCDILLDFPRERYRALLHDMAARQTGWGSHFDANDIDQAYAAGRDQPQWERFTDPWRFYEPSVIEARQRRWAEEDRAARERSNGGLATSLWPEPYIRPEPKVGRNDPCPCGSGKKYKKCCLDG